MELTQQVRDYAAAKGLDDGEALSAGMQDKSKEFRREREIYVKDDAVKPSA